MKSSLLTAAHCHWIVQGPLIKTLVIIIFWQRLELEIWVIAISLSGFPTRPNDGSRNNKPLRGKKKPSWILLLSELKSEAPISYASTGWFKDFGSLAVAGGSQPKLDAQMSSCVCCCGLSKWHCKAPNWLHTQERRNNWMNEICSWLFTHQCGFFTWKAHNYARSRGDFLA